MKPARFVCRILSRFALVALAAALFAGLTGIYAGTMRPPPRFANPYRLAARRRRPLEPQLGRLPGFIGEGVLFALIAVAGRKVLRLRLTD